MSSVPRPTKKSTGALWALLDAWAERQRSESLVGHKPTQVEMAHLFGVSDSLLGQWKFRETRVQTEDMERIARKTGLSFDEVMAAAREDLPAATRHVQHRRSSRRPPQGPQVQEPD